MKKNEKNKVIDSLTKDLSNNKNIYLTDISGLNVELTNKLRGLCFKKNVNLKTVKNTFLKKAIKKSNTDFEPFYNILEGPTSIMLSETGNIPAKIIKEFKKTQKQKKPVIKGAYVEETFYTGENLLEILINIKSKNEMIADIIEILKSPAKNIILALQSGAQTIIGIIKTLSEKSK